MSIGPIGSVPGGWNLFASHLARMKARTRANGAAEMAESPKLRQPEGVAAGSKSYNAPLLPPPPDRPVGGGVPNTPAIPLPASSQTYVVSAIPLPAEASESVKTPMGPAPIPVPPEAPANTGALVVGAIPVSRPR